MSILKQLKKATGIKYKQNKGVIVCSSNYRYSTYRNTVFWIKGWALFKALYCHKCGIPFQTGSIHTFEIVLFSILNRKRDRYMKTEEQSRFII